MDEAAFQRLIRGEANGVLSTLSRGGLAIASGGYRVAVAGRAVAFDRGWKAIHRADLPVISVGNITLGGTGKTPMVEWVARRLRERGLRVAILSRGYGGTEGLNDEGRVLEANLPDVPHLQARDRVALARVAAEELESEVAVLDDGFQHRRLARDLDIVLLDALDPFGLGRLFPRGLLREPVRSLRRAEIVVLSRADLVEPGFRHEVRQLAERRAGPLRWVEARQAPLDLVDHDVVSSPLDVLTGVRAVAFCGLGNPEGFRRTLSRLDVDVTSFLTFPDHHPYDRGDVSTLRRWAREHRAELALTTQKDLVKLRMPTLDEVPLRALRIGLDVLEGQHLLVEALDAIVQKARPRSNPT